MPYDTRIVQIRLRNKLNASCMLILSEDNVTNLQILFYTIARELQKSAFTHIRVI